MADIGYIRDNSITLRQLFGQQAGGSVSVGHTLGANSQTLMQKINPQASFKFAGVETNNLMRSAQNLNQGDLGTAQAQAGIARDQIQNMQADFSQTWQTAQAVIAETIKEVALERDINPGVVMRSLIPNTGTTGAEAAASLTANAFTGAAVSAAEAVLDAIGERKQLKPGELQNFMEEVQTRLASQNPQQQEAMAVRHFGPDIQPDMPESGLDFSQTTGLDLARIVQSPPELQPEMLELQRIEDGLDEVDTNHAVLEDDLDAGRAGLAAEGLCSVSGLRPLGPDVDSLCREIEGHTPPTPQLTAAAFTAGWTGSGGSGSGDGDTTDGATEQEQAPDEELIMPGIPTTSPGRLA